MPLILELPGDLEAELLAHWQRAGLIETASASLGDQEDMQESTADLRHFRLPNALQTRLQNLLDRQDGGDMLTPEERLEAESLVELAELLSLLHLRSLATAHQN